ncbi:glycoside hydrolase family 20 zincin-like fold domain-containing protein [Pedobacter sp. HDW13]|uniref:glycoside hydrolase family 20 zincin-like fold domain-containing protein n=1 Tax=Pedobacter sp. HDW13 TaxID=2714940 RepID=UPI001F0F7591|nr:glycoside hydrolase family 20 zincin-like fold domain-containing protein [Pedobacter sp. HDW13]
MRKIIFLFLILISFKISAQEVNIIPQPAYLDIKKTQKPFIIDAKTQIVVIDSALTPSADFLNDYLQKYYKLKLNITNVTPGGNFIKLISNTRISEFDDAYSLIASDQNLAIIGTSKPGYFMASNHFFSFCQPQQASKSLFLHL